MANSKYQTGRIGDALGRKMEQSPQLDYLWRVELPALTAGIDPTGGILTSAASSVFGSSLVSKATTIYNAVDSIAKSVTPENGMEDINHRVTSFETPFRSFESKEISQANSNWKSASNNSVGQITMILDEFEDGKTLEYLTTWHEMIRNPNGSYNVPFMYKKDITFYRVSGTQMDLHRHTYRGCWVSEISPIQNNYESNGVLQYSATLMVDNVDHLIIPESVVKAKVAAAEGEIMQHEWDSKLFDLGKVDIQSASKVLRSVINLF